MHWTQISPNIFMFEDSCNVYAAIGPEGALIIDAGTGAWLEHAGELPARPVALACTHFFRDHSAGAARAAAAGIPVFVPEGERAIFADPIQHSPGRVARVAPFQYNYNDLGGAVNAFYAARDLRSLHPRALLPSLGRPMLDGCDAALAQLQASLAALCAGRAHEAAQIADAENPKLEQVTPHVWKTTQTSSINWFVISESGKALVIDYGYHERRGLLAPGYSKPYRRRALLHSLDELKQRTGIDRVDVALISHFHDDHVCGVPLLQRLHGTQCWASEAFADLLARPDAHCFPCDWPQPIRVDKRIAHSETARWEEYEFRFAPMNGHTRFASLIGFEADGKRYAHTGDQYFFEDGRGEWVTGEIARWDDKRVMQNHVYRNGALLDGFSLSGGCLLAWRPDIVISGHQAPMHTDDDFFALVDAWSREYADLHRRAMALGDADAHFNIDSWGGWIWPYRTRLDAVQPFEVTVTVRNPLPRPATLDVRLVGPEGWAGTSASLRAEARAEVSCALSLTPSGPCELQPFAVELVADGRPFGQVAEALVSVGIPAAPPMASSSSS